MNKPQLDTTRTMARESIMVFVFVMVVMVGAYFARFAFDKTVCLSPAAEAWGQFGDYLGGVLNPIVAFLALLWLIKSVLIQDTELRETREALTKSANAQTSQVQIAALSSILTGHNADIQALQTELSRLGHSATTAGLGFNDQGLMLRGDTLLEYMRQLNAKLLQQQIERAIVIEKLKRVLYGPEPAPTVPSATPDVPR